MARERADKPARTTNERHAAPRGTHRGAQRSGAAPAAGTPDARPTLATRQAAAGSHNEPLPGRHAERRQAAWNAAHPDAAARVKAARAKGTPKRSTGDFLGGLFAAVTSRKVTGKDVAKLHAQATRVSGIAARHHKAGGGDTSLEGLARTALHTVVEVVEEETRPTVREHGKPGRQARGRWARNYAAGQTARVMRTEAKRAGDAAVAAAKAAGTTDRAKLAQVRRQATYDFGATRRQAAGEGRAHLQRVAAHSPYAHGVEAVTNVAGKPKRWFDRFTRTKGTQRVHDAIDRIGR